MTKLRVNHDAVSRWFFILIAGAVLYIFWKMVSPFAITLITAGIFTVVFFPFFNWLNAKFKNKFLSAITILFIVFFAIFLPVTAFAFVVVQQAADVLQSGLIGNVADFISGFSDSELFSRMPQFAQNSLLSIDFGGATRATVDWLRQNVGSILAGGVNFTMQLLLFFLFLYYFLIKGDRIHRELLELSPFKDKLDENIIIRINRTIRGVMGGAVVIASVQAVLAIIGLSIFGVPKAPLWGAFVLIAAQVPIFGVGTIMVPSILYLLIVGNTGSAIGLAIWSVVVVGLVDNMLSPIVVGKRTQMPELFVLISILGGIQYFGPIGFILGPVVLSGILVLRDLYKAGILKTRS